MPLPPAVRDLVAEVVGRPRGPAPRGWLVVLRVEPLQDLPGWRELEAMHERVLVARVVPIGARHPDLPRLVVDRGPAIDVDPEAPGVATRPVAGLEHQLGGGG